MCKVLHIFKGYGNPRTHENPFMLTLATIWFRYHNFIAGELEKKNPSFNDEQLFNAARKRVIAQYQVSNDNKALSRKLL